MKNIYGKFPEFLEVMSVIRNIYGEDFHGNLRTRLQKHRKFF